LAIMRSFEPGTASSTRRNRLRFCATAISL
jgi:hypothetical protein